MLTAQVNPFILKSGENHEKSNNILYWGFRENHQLLDENTKNIIYDDFLFSFDIPENGFLGR